MLTLPTQYEIVKQHGTITANLSIYIGLDEKYSILILTNTYKIETRVVHEAHKLISKNLK